MRLTLIIYRVAVGPREWESSRGRALRLAVDLVYPLGKNGPLPVPRLFPWKMNGEEGRPFSIPRLNFVAGGTITCPDRVLAKSVVGCK